MVLWYIFSFTQTLQITQKNYVLGNVDNFSNTPDRGYYICGITPIFVENVDKTVHNLIFQGFSGLKKWIKMPSKNCVQIRNELYKVIFGPENRLLKMSSSLP